MRSSSMQAIVQLGLYVNQSSSCGELLPYLSRDNVLCGEILVQVTTKNTFFSNEFPDFVDSGFHLPHSPGNIIQ